jgi:hypothetical protein
MSGVISESAGLIAGKALNVFVFLPMLFLTVGLVFLFGLHSGLPHAAWMSFEAAIGLQIGYGMLLAGQSFALRMFDPKAVEPMRLPVRPGANHSISLVAHQGQEGLEKDL